MDKLSRTAANNLNVIDPGNAIAKTGSRLKELSDYGVMAIVSTVAAGAANKIAAITLPTSPDTDGLFDFEILEVTVRTESAVTSSTVQVKNGTTAVTDAIISAADKAITRAASIDKTYNKFYPQSDPAGYAAAPCNLVDAGGATAAARTVILWVRRL